MVIAPGLIVVALELAAAGVALINGLMKLRQNSKGKKQASSRRPVTDYHLVPVMTFNNMPTLQMQNARHRREIERETAATLRAYANIQLNTPRPSPAPQFSKRPNRRLGY